jgi:hypothetical protein
MVNRIGIVIISVLLIFLLLLISGLSIFLVLSSGTGDDVKTIEYIPEVFEPSTGCFGGDCFKTSTKLFDTIPIVHHSSNGDDDGSDSGECSKNSDCNDRDDLTIDICIDPGKKDSICEYETIVCNFDNECDDDSELTDDTCLLPGSNEAVCENLAKECTVNTDCGSEGYCDLSSGELVCSTVGVCSEQPEVCAQEVNLVCGCDGETYNNSCVLASSGVSLQHIGECSETHDSICTIATELEPGFKYQLIDHPKGAISKPDYGLRFGSATYSFDADEAEIFMYYNPPHFIEIKGNVYGGFDIGEEWDNPVLSSFEYVIENGFVEFTSELLKIDFEPFGISENCGSVGNRTFCGKSNGVGNEFNINLNHREESGLSGFGWVKKMDGDQITGDFLFRICEGQPSCEDDIEDRDEQCDVDDSSDDD